MSIHPGEPKFDIRIRERSLREETLTKQELESHLKRLPDESKNAQEILVFEENPNSEETTKEASKKSSELTFSAINEVEV